ARRGVRMGFGRVLVADDDDAFCRTVAVLVERAGLTVQVASTGEEALALARAGRPAVVILDVGLRDRSGYETCRDLRELYGETLPSLLVSAERTDPNDRIAGLLLGAGDYLTTPLDRGELLARIRRAAARSTVEPLRREGTGRN